MLNGRCPFRSPEAQALDEDVAVAMDKATLTWDPPYDPIYFDDAAKDLLQKLFLRDPEKRIGFKGAKELKRHPWFASIDWGLLDSLRVTPPFIPSADINAADQQSIGAFDECKEVLTAEDQKGYEGWEFISKDAFKMELVDYLQWEQHL